MSPFSLRVHAAVAPDATPRVGGLGGAAVCARAVVWTRLTSAGTRSVRRADTAAMAIPLGGGGKGGPHIPPPPAGAQERAPERGWPGLAHVSLGSSVTRGAADRADAAAVRTNRLVRYARGESRTLTGLPPGDFESPASAIPPLGRASRSSVGRSARRPPALRACAPRRPPARRHQR